MMKIGFVTTWFERGAAYVTKQYIDLLKESHDVYVYARGGEEYAIGDEKWDLDYVTWGTRLGNTDQIKWNDFKKWIKKNDLDIIFYNEQRDITSIFNIKKHFPHIKVGTYIDYYKQDTIQEFAVYDFLICNTKRHYSVFNWHSQCYYLPWGTDIELFNPCNKEENDIVTFFHSAGMSLRKGTKYLIDVFYNSDLKLNSKLLIHTQIPLKNFTDISKEELLKNNIEIIEGTVTAPGLFHKGDIYVYPTELDGLGLTLYEALSCGLPVITTDNGPMNEVISEKNGKLISVEKFICRADAYYWPLSIVDKQSLYTCMKESILKKPELESWSNVCRAYAVDKYNWNDRKDELNNIFSNLKITYLPDNAHEDAKMYLYKKYGKIFNTIIQQTNFKSFITGISHLKKVYKNNSNF